MRWFASGDHRATAEALEWSVRRALMGEPRLRDVEAPRIRISASGAGAITLVFGVSMLSQSESPAILGARLFGNLNATLFAAIWILVPLLVAAITGLIK